MQYRFLLWLAAFGLLAGSAAAQSPNSKFGFTYGSVAKVMQGADTLRQAWAGGLNTPQFSAIELNGDNHPDLYAFDRETSRSYTFLSVADATGAGRHYQYAPDYERIFPDNLKNWVLLRDYDCDGRVDLFTDASNNVRVFRNVPDASGRPGFILASNLLTYPQVVNNVSYDVNIAIGYYNLPAIQDVNGDGRLDILVYDYAGATNMYLYLNTSTGSCGGVNSFEFVTNYWGQIQSCFSGCGAYQPNGRHCSTYKVTHTTGHSLLLLDLNGDGKLDVLDGRDNCPLLTRMFNSGASNAAATLDSVNISSAFPPSAPVNLSVYPTPFSLDADFDGVSDLVVTSNTPDNSQDYISMRNNVWLYKNTATSAGAVPNYVPITHSFLQGDMIDVSEGAAPTFGDIDGDGLTDMLVGNQADLVNGYYRGSLAYYRNVGTAHRPVLKLVTEDYLGLAAQAALTPTVRFQNLRPQLVDLNRDGALDLAYSAYNGTENRLYYILNTANAGQAAAFNLASASYFKPVGVSTGGLPSRQGDTPCFFDVDGDGYVDLLLGTNSSPGYRLQYFRNQGVATQGKPDYMFVLSDNDYGTLRVTNFYGFSVNLAPLVADFDKDGNPDLLTVDNTGTVRLYPNFRSQGARFTERTDLFYNSLSQQFEPSRLSNLNANNYATFAAAAADLNQDGLPELYIGTETGGVVSYLTGTRTVALATHAAASQALGLGLYPNPASASTTVETAQPTRLRLLDLTGRLVQQDATLLRSHTLSLQGLAAGVYLVQAVAADGTSATQRLSVQ